MTEKESSLQQYLYFFNHAPIALWIEDFSEAKQYLKKIAKQNNTSISTYLKEKPEILNTLNKKVKVENVNQEALKLYNAKSKEELLGRSLENIVEKESIPVFNNILRGLLNGEKNISAEATNKTKNGRTINILIKAKAIDNLDKVMVSVENTTQEIIAKKTAEKTEKVLLSTLSGVKEALIVLDKNTNFKYANNEAKRLLEFNFEEIKGKNFWEVYTKNKEHVFYKKFTEAVKTKKTVEFEYYHRPWNIWLEIRIISSADGTLIFYREITEERKHRSFIKHAYNIINKSESVAFLSKNEKGIPLVFASENTSKIFGYSAEDFLKQRIRLKDILHPSSQEEAKEAALSAIKGEIPKGYKTKPTQIITKKGELKWVQANVYSIKDHLGRTTHIQGIVSDITRLMKDRELIESSRRTYYEIFERTYDAVFIIKNNWIVNCNQATVELFGYENKYEIIGSRPTEDSPKFQEDGEPSDVMAEKMIALTLEKGNHRFKWLKKKKDGTIFPTEVTLTKLKDIQGEDIIHVLIRDITEQERKEKLERVIFNISKASNEFEDFERFAIFIKKELHKVIDTSNFYIAFYNKKENEISIGFSQDKRLVLPKGISAEKTLTGVILKTGKPLLVDEEKYEKFVAQKQVIRSGHPAKVWLGVPLKDSEGIFGVLGLQSYSNPNAYSKKDVELFEFVANQISTTIQRKNTDEKLKEAVRRAQESDKLKSSFLANISHEIRTPMNGIIGFSELLANEKLTKKEIIKYAEIINSSGVQLLSIVNDVLDISKIESGVVKLHPQTDNLNKIINELHLFYKQIAQEKGLKLNCTKELSNEESFISTDITKLKQVLTNLITNAIKFTNKGSISFGYTVEKNLLKFYVKDTGIGIEKKYQRIIFNRFVQAENSPKQHKGTGLGLAICKKTIELFKGDIWIEKSNSKGTTICFTIPYKKEEESHKQEKQTTATTTSKTILKDKKTILIADDEMFNRLFITEIFAKTNLKIIEVENGKQAVEKSREKTIDLILMDLKMPIMGGVEALKIIKQEKPNLPIIGLSAFAMESDKQKALEQGFDDYVTKPINKTLLFKVISKHLKANIN